MILKSHKSMHFFGILSILIGLQPFLLSKNQPLPTDQILTFLMIQKANPSIWSKFNPIPVSYQPLPVLAIEQNNTLQIPIPNAQHILDACNTLQIAPEDITLLHQDVLHHLYQERLNSVAQFRMRHMLEKEITQAYTLIKNILNHDPTVINQLDLTPQDIDPPTLDPTVHQIDEQSDHKNLFVHDQHKPPLEWLDPLTTKDIQDLDTIKEQLTHISDIDSNQNIRPTINHLQYEIDKIHSQLDRKIVDYIQEAHDTLNPYLQAIEQKLSTDFSQAEINTINNSVEIFKKDSWSWLQLNQEIQLAWKTLMQNCTDSEHNCKLIILALKHWLIKKYLSDDHISHHFQKILDQYDPATQAMLINQAMHEWHEKLQAWAPENPSSDIFELAFKPLFNLLDQYAFVPQSFAITTGTQTIFEQINNVQIREQILAKILLDSDLKQRINQDIWFKKDMRSSIAERHRYIT